MDIVTLERQIHKDKTLWTKENYLALFHHHEAIYQTLSFRDKIKLSPKLGFLVYQAFKCGHYTVEDLKNYIDYLKKYGIKASNLSQVIAKFYSLTGGEPKVLSTTVRSVNIESGVMAVSDVNFVATDNNLVEHLNHGEIFYCGTGGDGSFGANLRCIEGAEPSPTSKEFRFIVESTESAVISVPSGILAITDIGIDPLKSHVQIKVTPGNYLVRFHLKDIPNKFFGFVIVVCKTELPATNNFTEIPGLG